MSVFSELPFTLATDRALVWRSGTTIAVCAHQDAVARLLPDRDLQLPTGALELTLALLHPRALPEAHALPHDHPWSKLLTAAARHTAGWSSPLRADPSFQAACLELAAHNLPQPASLRAFARVFAQLDPQRAHNLAATGNPDLPRPLPDLPQPEPDDPDLHQLHLWADLLRRALTLPHHAPGPPDLGAAGITHRGTLDRLLLSELAHDPDVLTLRLAQHHALYLDRLTPTSPPPPSRALLLDHGLRTWGAPRWLILAAGLALTTPQTHTVRPDSASLTPLDLSSPDALRDHLASLGTHTHPGPALPAFFDLPHDQHVLVTTPDTLADPDFRAALTPHTPAHVLTLAPDGTCSLLLAHSARLTTLHTTRLDTTPARVTPSRDHAHDPLPAALRATPFPLRSGTRLPLHTHHLHPTPQGPRALGFHTPTQRLLLWTQLHAPPLELASFTKLPLHRPLLVRLLPDDTALLVTRTPHGNRLLTASTRAPHNVTRRTLPNAPPAHAAFLLRPGPCLVTRDHLVLVRHDGTPIADLLLPMGYRHVRDHLFRYGLRWYRAHYDGDLTLRPVEHASYELWPRRADGDPSDDAAELWTLHPGHVAPALEPPDPHSAPRIPKAATAPNYLLDAISHDGHRLLRSAGPGPSDREGLDLRTSPIHTTRLTPHDTLRWLEPLVARTRAAAPQTLRRCRQLGVLHTSVGRSLALRTRRRAVLELTRTPTGWRWLPTSAHHNFQHPRTFEHWRPLGRLDYTHVEWPSGHRAVLDPRGILHLHSPEPPHDLSVVLANHSPTGFWIDGQVFGPTSWFSQGIRLRHDRSIVAFLSLFLAGIA